MRRQATEIGPLPKKAQGLLAYLALHPGQALARERLAALLWGDARSEQARRSLRECLRSIRAIMGGDAKDALAADGNGGRLALPKNTDVDATRFEQLVRSSRLEDLEAAHGLYRGEFLAELHIASEPFEEWLVLKRRRLAAAMSDLLLRLASMRADAGNSDGAVEAAQHLTIVDPLREEGHRLLIRLLAASGRRSAALAQHAQCVSVLRRDLGVAPEPATTHLAEQIRAGLLPAASSGRDNDAASGAGEPQSPAVQGEPKRAIDAHEPRDKLSIAVLPFANLSGDPDQDRFAQGITEDITNALGHMPGSFVIASSSAIAYRGRAADLREIGRELGVGYVLRGSVRRLGERVRIIVQLLDTLRSAQIWSECFEDDLVGVFDIQDRVATQAAAMIGPALQSIEIERAHRKPTANLTAYDLYLRAVPRFRKSLGDNEQALNFLRRAIELDPSYATAYALAARCFHFQRVMGWVHPGDSRLQEGVRLARLAAECGRNDSEALWMAGLALVFLAGELDHGAALIEKSISLNPNSANAWIASCFAQAFLADSGRAIEDFARAQRLNPLDTMHHLRWNALGNAYFVAGRFERAAQAADRTLHESPTYPSALRMKVATCGLLGRLEEGHRYVRQLLAVNPGASLSSLRAFWAPLLRLCPDALESYLRGLRHAGLPVK